MDGSIFLVVAAPLEPVVKKSQGDQKEPFDDFPF